MIRGRDMDKKYYIYMHVNKENQKKYIGMSCQKTY
nr:MAG TPA: intron-associated endonuclease 1 [Caudoviricetes sp.]